LQSRPIQDARVIWYTHASCGKWPQFHSALLLCLCFSFSHSHWLLSKGYGQEHFNKTTHETAHQYWLSGQETKQRREEKRREEKEKQDQRNAQQDCCRRTLARLTSLRESVVHNIICCHSCGNCFQLFLLVFHALPISDDVGGAQHDSHTNQEQPLKLEAE